MLLAKLKTVAALVMGVLVLGVGAGAWHYAAAEQAEKQTQVLPNPVRAAPDVGEKQEAKIRPIPAALPKSRAFQIDLKIVERKDEQRKLLAEPRLITLEGRPASFACGDYRTIQLGGGMTESVLVGPSIRAVIRSVQEGKVLLDLTVSLPMKEPCSLTVSRSLTGIHEAVELVGTKTLRLLRAMTLRESITFEIEDKHSPALIVTAVIREAKIRIEEEEKTPARVGQIFITGNKKIRDEVILKEIPLFPGQILTFPDVRIVEQKLSRLKGIKSTPKVSIIDREDDNEFKDIQITVEEK